MKIHYDLRIKLGAKKIHQNSRFIQECVRIGYFDPTLSFGDLSFPRFNFKKKRC